jgi:hypothetical protein
MCSFGAFPSTEKIGLIQPSFLPNIILIPTVMNCDFLSPVNADYSRLHYLKKD